MSTQKFTITDTSPAAASTVVGSIARNLNGFDSYIVSAALVGATGGTLDVYLQREIGEDGSAVWEDWIHFPQLASGASAVKYVVTPTLSNTIVAVGRGTSPALAANTCAGGPPTNRVRAVYVAGASTSAGATVSITITASLLPR